MTDVTSKIYTLDVVNGKVYEYDVGTMAVVEVDVLSPGVAANGLPPGGTTGQVLSKDTDSDYDVTWIDPGSAALVDSVFGRTGDVVATAGDYNTDEVTEATNLYFTEARANAASDVVANTAARHTHANLAVLDAITDAGSGIIITDAERTKLAGIAEGAEANAVDSVNGATGVVVLDTGDIAENGNLYFTEARANAASDVVANTVARHTHSNKAQLDLVTDGDHDVRIDNPHGVTAVQVGALTDAPSDGNQYARQDGAWQVVVGGVESVFGRTGAVVATTNDYTWDQIDKTVSSLADLTTRSHTLLTDVGTNTHAQIDTHLVSTANPHGVTLAQVGVTDSDDISEGAANLFMTTAERSKLAGVEAGAEANVVDSVFGRTGVVVGTANDYDGITLWKADSLHLESGTGTGTSIGKIQFSSVADRTIDYHAAEDAIAISPRILLLNSRDEAASTAIGFGAQVGDPLERPNMTYWYAQDQFRFNRPGRFYSTPSEAGGFDPHSTALVVFKGGAVVFEESDIQAEDVYVNYFNTREASYLYFHNCLGGGLADPEAYYIRVFPEDTDFPFQVSNSMLLAGDLHLNGLLYLRGVDPGSSLAGIAFKVGGFDDNRLIWDDTDSRFDFSQPLNVQGTVTAEGLGLGNVFISSGQGVITPYHATADTNAARGAALVAAIAAASSGDTVYVGAGVYDTLGLMKDGITLHMQSGAVVHYTGSTSEALFQDDGSAMSMVVDGHGEFVHDGTGANKQVVNTTNGASTLFMRCRRLESVAGVGVRVSGTGSGGVRLYADEVVSGDGTLDNVSSGRYIEVHARRVASSNNFCIESDGGDVIVHGAVVDNTGGSTNPVEYVSGDLVKLVDCTIVADDGEPCISGLGGAADSVILIRCELDSSETTPLQLSNVTLKDCWRKNSTDPVTCSGTIKDMDPVPSLDPSDLGQQSATTGQVLEWSGSQWAPATVDKFKGISNGTTDIDVDGSEYLYFIGGDGVSVAVSDPIGYGPTLEISIDTAGQHMSFASVTTTSFVLTNTIYERTIGSGVNVNGMSVKDGKIPSTAAQVDAPSSSSDSGTAGDIAWDSDYLYVCTATGTWKRIALSTF